VESRIHLLHHSKIIKSQKGFSLIEILVVIGLSAIVVLGNSMFMNDFMKNIEKYGKESSEESDLAVLNTMALNILKKSSLSFNRLSLKDDNNVNFFDFYPDMPYSSFSSESRIFTLSGTAKYFYILSSDEGRFSSTVFDPVHAYIVNTPPADVVTDGTTTYRGLNSVPDFTNDAGTKASAKMMTQIFGTRWATGKVFVVTCPTYLRPITGAATVNLATAPRMPTIVGRVSGDDIELLTSTETGVPINNTHPVTGAAYASLDNYFRTLPTVGGAAPFVKIEPALVSRFELIPSTTASGYFDLYLKYWTAAGYAEQVQVALKVKTVTFKRKSITLPIISMEIQK
jgi:prepilin-type N-terminal cleavage/methylation domain-containing protein